MRTEATAGTALLALVANEQSGSSDPELFARRLRSFGARVEVYPVEDVSRALAIEPSRLVVAGGDGSIAPVAAAAGEAGLPLAVIPAGTANDFARRLGLPDEQAAACRLAVRGTRLRPLELGWMQPPAGGNDRRPFVNVASTGLPAPAARTAASWKKPLGALGYAAGALVAGLRADPLGAHVECDGQELFAGDAWQVSVAASGAFGGGSTIEDANPSDGDLEVVAVGAGPRPGLVGLAYRLRRGRVSEHRRAERSSCSTALVAVAAGSEWNVDGELLPFGPARFSGERAAFELVVG
ncbi:MAG TPA: diacylglycerol kinase family protein [Thermoleophilaceae bacterium]|nr:diacylglycerol kinase family protein [Thermoleophilaceae bacterium]